MNRCLWVGSLLIVGIVASALRAQMPEVPGPPPGIAMVSKVDAAAGTLELVYSVSKLVYATKIVEMELDGQKKQVTVAVEQIVCESVAKQIPLDSLRVVTAGKERLSRETALERLQPGLFVLHHRTSGKFDPRYLSVLAPSTLILLETPSEATPVAMPRPAGTITPPAAPTPAVGIPAPAAPVPGPVPKTVPGPVVPAKPVPGPAVPGPA